jgi:hypothetical protein
MESVDKFAAEVVLFERWLLHGQDRDADAAREGLVRVVRLYAAALDLPWLWSTGHEGPEPSERLPQSEWKRAYDGTRRLPVDLYIDVYNPTSEPSEEPVTGSVSDDLADIYRDVADGLRIYERGDHTEAAWQWSFGLHSHWGAHATSAIRVLHWWLSNNAFDRLTSES